MTPDPFVSDLESPVARYAEGGTRNRVPLKVIDRDDFRRAALRRVRKSSFASVSVVGTYVAPAESVFVRSRANAEPPATIVRSWKVAARSCSNP